MNQDRLVIFHILKDLMAEDAFDIDDSRYGDKITDFVRAAVYGTLTYMVTIDHIIKLASKRSVEDMDPDTALVLRIGAWQLLFSDKVPVYAAVNTSVELAKTVCRSSSGFVNAVLHKILELPEEKKDRRLMRPDVRVSLKSEIFGVLKSSYGRERAISIGEAFLEVPPLTARFDPKRISFEELSLKLQRDGYGVKPGEFMEEAVIITPSEIPIDKTAAFIDGDIMMQGEGAMLASRIANPHPGDLVLDCCCAPGGKTTHMALLADDDLTILAMDKKGARLERVRENLQRLKIRSVELSEGDGTTFRSDRLFDIILADVPCSGTGLLGGKPDIRVKLDYERIKSLIPVQAEILSNISSYVAPGGTLVYSTCSVNKAENEKQIESFLVDHPDFYADDITQYLPSKLIMDEERKELAGRGLITLLPDTDHCEGFFVARLKRR